MGLDTSHNCWHGSYRTFRNWRTAIAHAAGYATANVKYDDGMCTETIMLDWGHLPPGYLDGEWDKIPDDPLLILLTHSDCDGHIKHKHCAVLADAIEKILPNLEDILTEETDERMRDMMRKLTTQFIDGLRLAAEKQEDVDFH